jgi:hypothetical protein
LKQGTNETEENKGFDEESSVKLNVKVMVDKTTFVVMRVALEAIKVSPSLTWFIKFKADDVDDVDDDDCGTGDIKIPKLKGPDGLHDDTPSN